MNMENYFNINSLIFCMMIMFMMFMIFPFSYNTNPLFLGIKLMIFNIFNSIILMFNMKNNWYSFLLFLIIVGGLMIMFLYFTSFIMNLKLLINNFDVKQMKFLLILWLLFMLMLMNNKYSNMMSSNMFENLFIENNNLMMNLNNNLLFNEKIKSLMFLYNKPMYLISLFLMLYLFFSLTTIVKISFFKKKMIRKMN